MRGKKPRRKGVEENEGTMEGGREGFGGKGRISRGRKDRREHGGREEDCGERQSAGGNQAGRGYEGGMERVSERESGGARAGRDGAQGEWRRASSRSTRFSHHRHHLNDAPSSLFERIQKYERVLSGSFPFLLLSRPLFRHERRPVRESDYD